MTNQQKYRFGLVGVLVALTLLFAYTTYSYWVEEPKQVVVAEGVIQKKFDSEYACGSKSRSTCYARYFVINHEPVSVNQETYTTHFVGNSVSIVTTVEAEFTIFRLFAFIWMVACGIAAAGFALVIIGESINWAINKSDRWSYKEYMKHTIFD